MHKWLTAFAIGFTGFAFGAAAVLAGVYYRADILAASERLAPLVEGLVEARGVGDRRSTPANGPATAAWTLDSDNLLQEILRLPSDFEQTLTLYGLLRDADGDDLERLLDQARLLRPASEGQAAASILYSRYAEVDPHAAVERVVDRGRFDRPFLRGIFTAWAKYDVDAALASANELPPELRRQAGSGVLLGSARLAGQRRQEIASRFSLRDQLDWMDTNELIVEEPAAAWQRALASKNKTSMLSMAGLAWVELDPAAALNAVAALAKADDRHALNRVLMERWASADPDAARHWGLSQLNAKVRGPQLQGIAAGIAQNNPEEALSFALELDGTEREEAARVVFAHWAREDPVAAAEALTMLDDDAVLAVAGGNVVREWAEQDPYAAFEWLTQDVGTRSYGNWHKQQISHALDRIAQSDPRSALELASRLSGEARRRGLTAAMNAWAKSDPSSAASWLEDAVEADQQTYDRLADTVVGWLAIDDPQTAFRWVRSQPLSTQMSAMPFLVSFVSDRSLNEATRLIARIGDNDVRQAAAMQVAWKWGGTQPEEAVRWITREVPASERKPLLDNVFSAWTYNDRDAAVAAMRRLRRSDRDTAAVAILQSALQDAPDVAERVYKDIRDDTVRRVAAQTLYWHFHEEDVQRADRYFDDADFDGETQRYLQSAVVERH